MLKPNIQLFAETAPTEPTTDPATEPTKPKNKTDNPPPDPPSSEPDYKATIKSLLGLGDDDEIDDLDAKIKDYKSKADKRLKAANDKLIAAALKGYTQYDQKLLPKLVDLSAVKVEDDGAVTGLEAAVEAAAKEYPAMVIKTDSKPFLPINQNNEPPKHKNMNDLIRGKRR